MTSTLTPVVKYGITTLILSGQDYSCVTDMPRFLKMMDKASCMFMLKEGYEINKLHLFKQKVLNENLFGAFY